MLPAEGRLKVLVSSGDEWLLEGDAELSVLIACAEAVCDAWPEAVLEDTAAGEFAHSMDSLLPAEDTELCIYRDLDVARRWQHGGRPEEVRNSMIQLSLTPRGVRLIADDWNDPSIDEVVAEVDRWRVSFVRRTVPGAGVPHCGNA